MLDLTADQRREFRLRCRRDPGWFCRTILGGDDWQMQVAILESVRDNVRTAAKSCHGIGKTWIGARAALWFLYSHPLSLVVTTAPTWRQVEELMWREIAFQFNNSRVELQGDLMLTCKLNLDDKWRAIGVSTKEPERFAGFHARYVLLIFDEASGVDQRIFEAAKGVMSSGHCRLLMLGNPTRAEGEFFNAFNGKRSMHRCLSVPAWETPNVKPHWPKFQQIREQHGLPAALDFLRSDKCAPTLKYLVNCAWVADMLEEFGEDSAVYASRVAAEFPSEGADQLIPLKYIEDAQYRWEEIVHPSPVGGRRQRGKKWWESLEELAPETHIGVDVARFGDCERVIYARHDSVAAPPIILPPQQLDTLAGSIQYHACQFRATHIKIDDVGMGGGPVDILRTAGVEGLFAYQGGAKPYDDRYFANVRAEDYWALAKRFKEGRIAIPPDQKTMGQLSSLRYSFNARGQMIIESKDALRKRGLASPDRADALCMAFAERHGGSFAAVAELQDTLNRQPIVGDDVLDVFDTGAGLWSDQHW
jgi:hypothetical protein